MAAHRAWLCGALCAAMAAVVPAAEGADDQRHSLANRLTTAGALVASASGTLTFQGPNDYDARFCIDDERADGIGPRMQFKYTYESGEVHWTRRWGNDSGAGSSVCHASWVDGSGPRIAWISATLIADGVGTATCHYPNRFVLGSSAYGTTARCGGQNPPPPPAPPPAPSPTPTPTPTPMPTPSPPPPPPVVVPGPVGSPKPLRQKGCTSVDKPIVVRLSRDTKHGSRRLRVLSVLFALRGHGIRRLDRRPPFRVAFRRAWEPGSRVRVQARVRYRWRGTRRVLVQRTARVVKICAGAATGQGFAPPA